MHIADMLGGQQRLPGSSSARIFSGRNTSGDNLDIRTFDLTGLSNDTGKMVSKMIMKYNLNRGKVIVRGEYEEIDEHEKKN